MIDILAVRLILSLKEFVFRTQIKEKYTHQSKSFRGVNYEREFGKIENKNKDKLKMGKKKQYLKSNSK